MHEKITNSLGMTFVKIQSGKFYMGARANDPYETPLATLHGVTLTQDFYIGQFPIRKRDFKQVMKNAPANRFVGFNQGESDECPVVNVSWYDANEFCTLLSRMVVENEAGRSYRLPTEAEWEYCCRAGSEATFCFGDDARELPKYAWFEKNSRNKSQPVGMLRPNNWGLYDFHGNVAEWCSDWFEEFSGEDQVDPKGPATGEYKVLRNGDWGGQVEELTCAMRNGGPPEEFRPSRGFRVVLTLVDGK